MADKITDPAILAQLNGPAPQPITDPETLAALNSDVHPDDTGVVHAIRSALSAADPYLRAAANGMTLGLADRFAAGAGAVTGIGGKGGDYSGNLKTEQAKTEQFAGQHPIGNAVAQTAGALATLPLAPAARAVEGATLGAKMLAGMGAGAAVGGVGGALSSHDLTDLPQTFRDAIFGARGGAVLGGAVPVVGRGIGAGANWLADALRPVPGISRSAASHLLDAVAADGPDAIRANLAKLGPDAVLADAGPALLGKLQGASLNSDEGRAIAQGRLTARNDATNARIQSDVNRALGPAEDPQTVSDAILAHRSAVDNVNYPAALDNAPAVQTGSILDQLDKGIPRSVGMERKALENLRGMLSKAAPEEVAAGGAAKPSEDATVAELRAKFGDTVANAYQKQQQKAAPTAAAAVPKGQSLLEFLASKGGLGPDSELGAIGADSHVVNVDGLGRRKLVRQGGWPLDTAREAAEEAGYLQGQNGATSTPRDLLDAIDGEIRGQKRYPQGLEGSLSNRERAAMSEREQHEFDAHMQGIHDDLNEAGYGDLGADVKARAAKLMSDRGMSADRAVDHAYSQLEQEEARGASGFPGDKAAPAAPGAPKRVPIDDATVLHKVKQELDNVIEYDAPGLGVPAGAVKNQQGALKWFRGQLNQALEKQVPGYAQANAASSALAKRAEAVKSGTQYLGNGKTTPSPARFAGDFGPLSQGEKIAFAKGSRGDIERVLGTKANDLQALRGELQGEGGWNTAKIATVHGQDAADQLMSSVERNLKFRDTHNKVVENSQTAQRTAAARAMKPEPSSETPIVNPNMTVTGLGGTLAKKAAVGLANALLQKDPTKAYGEISKILTTSGPEARAYLDALAKSIASRAAFAPKVSRGADYAALVAALAPGRYLGGRLGAPSNTR